MTPQELLAKILAQLQQQQAPANTTPPVAQPVVSPGVTPTTTTGLGQAAPIPATGLDPASMAELLKQTLAAYQQGGANVGGIYGATSANFVNPAQNFLLQLITGLMGQGFTEDQIMSDPNVMGYIQNLNSLLGNTSQNQATDQSWFEKMANLSTAALAQGALLGGGGGSGGGGGGGGGRRGYGGGGRGYRRYGGGGYGYGDGGGLDTKTTGNYQETASETMMEYAPGYREEVLNPFPPGSEEATLADRILAAGGTNPRNVRKITGDRLSILEALLETIEAQRAPAAAQQEVALGKANLAATDMSAGARAAAEQAFEREQARIAANRGIVTDDRILRQAGVGDPNNTWRGTPVDSGTWSGSISPTLGQNTASYVNSPDYREKWIRHWLSKRSKDMPIQGSLSPGLISKTRYGKQGQITPMAGPSAYDEYGNPLGQTLAEIIERMKKADWERNVNQKVFDVTTEMDPNVSPNLTQRKVVLQGQNKSQQSTWDPDYAIADDILQPTDDFVPGPAPGMNAGASGFKTQRRPQRLTLNPKITQELARRRVGYSDENVGAVNKGLATGPRKLIYENGGYKIAEKASPAQIAQKATAGATKGAAFPKKTKTPVAPAKPKAKAEAKKIGKAVTQIKYKPANYQAAYAALKKGKAKIR